METILFKLSGMMMQAVLWVGELGISGACCGEFCQPKVPEKMLKK